MAETLGLIASCVNIIQGLDTICTVAKENIHLGESASRELVILVGKVSSYKGVITGIQFQAELDKAAGYGRLSAVNHVNGPLKACEEATALIIKKIGSLSRRIHFGKIIDKAIAASLQAFDDALPVLQLALHADQR
jgi:hypothetical protein